MPRCLWDAAIAGSPGRDGAAPRQEPRITCAVALSPCAICCNTHGERTAFFPSPDCRAGRLATWRKGNLQLARWPRDSRWKIRPCPTVHVQIQSRKSQPEVVFPLRRGMLGTVPAAWASPQLRACLGCPRRGRRGGVPRGCGRRKTGSRHKTNPTPAPTGPGSSRLPKPLQTPSPARLPAPPSRPAAAGRDVCRGSRQNRFCHAAGCPTHGCGQPGSGTCPPSVPHASSLPDAEMGMAGKGYPGDTPRAGSQKGLAGCPGIKGSACMGQP